MKPCRYRRIRPFGRKACRIQRPLILLSTALSAISSLPLEASAQIARLEPLVQSYLWSPDERERARAEALLADDSLEAVSRMYFQDLEEIVRRGRPHYPPIPSETESGYAREEIPVTLSDGREFPVLVQLPPGFNQRKAWPLLLAMHGGPGTNEAARQGAEGMIETWAIPAAEAGWIVASPAMTTVVTVAPPTPERYPYEILRPEHALSILSEVAARYHIDHDRVVSTGFSIGSNFSVGYAGSMPDRFAAVVPVSTEGDSRELLLRNAKYVPFYVLEGVRDGNIRTIDGPRALASILTSFGYEIVYREFDNREHEHFQRRYPDVLAWLSSKSRSIYPRKVLRIPHKGIMPVSRRLYWVEADTRQALVYAYARPDNRIDVTARWAREIRIDLHDRLVDMDRPVEVWVNGEHVLTTQVNRSVLHAVQQISLTADPGRIFAGRIKVRVPQDDSSVAVGRKFWNSLQPQYAEGILSYWEMYAIRSLRERFRSLGLEGVEATDSSDLGLTGESTAIRVTGVDANGPFASAGIRQGDLLLEVGGEPFFDGHGLLSLENWLIRELTAEARRYQVLVLRDGKRIELTATLKLGPYNSDVQ